jgi:hypothetical protein
MFMLASGIEPAEMLMSHVATIAQASAIVRQERQLTYTKKLNDGTNKEWEGWWNGYGNNQRLIRVNGRQINATAEPSKDLDLARLMRSRFHFRMASTPEITGQECDGRRCFVVKFEPKDASELTDTDYLKDKKAEMIIGHLSGTAYIDAEHLYLVRIEGHLRTPFNRSTFVRIKNIEVVYRQRWSEELDIPIMTSSDINVRYSAFGIPGTEHLVYTYTNFRFTYPTPSQK